MAIEREEIEHIASLARLDISGAHFERLTEDMQGIVAMVDQLQKLELGDVPEGINVERKNAFREDVAKQEYTPDELLRINAPDFRAGGVVVPRVVE